MSLLACIDGPFLDCWPSVCDSDRRLVADGTSSIHDFPLIGGGSLPYTTSDLIIARLGSQYSVIEAVDDTGLGQLQGAALAVLNNVILAITNEINGYLAPIYPIPLRRRGTVVVIQVLTVDSNGVILTFQQPPFWPVAGVSGVTGFPRRTPKQPNGYYFIAPTAQAGSYATTGGNGTGCTLNVTFNGSPAPFSATAVTLASGGSGYVPYDVIGLTGGTSYLPVKINSAALALCCHALYARRLAPTERNQFEEEAALWRGTPTHPGELVKIGRGEIELDSDYPRTVSPGAAWVERDRLNMTSL